MGRLVHETTGIVMGIRTEGQDTFLPFVLAQSGMPVNQTGDTAERVLASIIVPAG